MKLNKRLAVSLLTACMLTSSFAPAVLAADNGENGAPASTFSDPIWGGTDALNSEGESAVSNVEMSGDCSKDSQSQVSWALTTNNDALYYNEQDNTFSSEPTEGATKEQAYTLTISGNGEMKDYEAGLTLSENATPWGTAIKKKLASTATVASYASPHITQVVFADNSNISYIGSHAFRSTSIKKIDIPDSVTSIGNYAMIQCKMLENIKIGGSTNTTATETKPFYVQNGVLYENYTEGEKHGVELRFYPLARTEDFTIPDGVTVIGSNSLQLGKMSAVTIPSSVRSINSYSFSSCKNLTSIALPNHVQFGSERELDGHVTNEHDDTYRGAGAFGNTENLREVTNFPNVEILPCNLFQNSGISSFTIPSTVKTIATSALATANITHITIPASVETIESSAFKATRTETFTIDFEQGSRLTSIGKYCFSGSSYDANFALGDFSAYNVFTSAGYTATMENWDGITDETFTCTLKSDQSVLITGFTEAAKEKAKEESGIDLVIPDEINGFPVTEIAGNAFAKDYNLLKTITIGKNVTKIGERAFHDSVSDGGKINDSVDTYPVSQLTSIVFEPGEDIEIADRAFQKFNTLNVTIDAGERKIFLGNNVFLDQRKITFFNMPNLQKTGYGIFFNAADKTSIVINGNASYDAKAFLDYTGSQENPSLSLHQATVYAVGEKVSKVVKAIPEQGNNILCVLNGGKIADLNAKVDSKTQLLTPVLSGFTFAGWYSDESLTTPLEGAAAKNTTYYAKWTKGSNDSRFYTSNPNNYFTYNTISGLQGTTEIPLGKQIAIADLSCKTSFDAANISDNLLMRSLENGNLRISMKDNLPAGTYHEKVSLTINGVYYEIPVTFTVGKAESTVTPDKTGSVTYGTYGSQLKIEVNVQKSEVSTLSAELMPNYAYFYYDNTLLGTAPVSYKEGSLSGTATFTYKTTDKKIPAGTNEITVKYGGGVNLKESQTECEVTIERKNVDLSKVAVENKIFDNTTDVTVIGGSLSGVLKGDEVGFSATGSTKDADVGKDKDVDVQAELTGKDAGFYKLTAVQTSIVTITPAPVTLSADKTTVKAGETVTFTAEGIPAGYDCSIAQISGETKADRLSDNSFSFPSAGTYTFTVQEPNGKENLTVNTVTITVEANTVYVPVTDPSDSFPAHKDGWSSSTKGDSYYVNGVKAKGWQEIGGETYYFNKKGILQTGWLKEGDNWYYLDAKTGAMQTGWVKDGNQWYYLDKDGVMKTGWNKIGGVWYYMNGNGVMKANSWLLENGKWYHFGGNGAMIRNHWLYEKGKWYYFGANGVMCHDSWNYINGKWYYFGTDGAMLSDTVTPDGYTIDSNGVWNG